MHNLGKHTPSPRRRTPPGGARHVRSVSPFAVIICIVAALAFTAAVFKGTTHLLETLFPPAKQPYGQVLPLDGENVNDAEQPRYQSPYDWSNLDHNNGRFMYYEDSSAGDGSDGNSSTELASMLGVDVSSHQKAIDWEAVAHDGVDFAIVRLGNRGYTEGGLMVDEYAQSNLDGARDAGLLVGAYFFSQAVSVDEAREEAELAIEILAGRTLDLPVAYDHEPVSSPQGRANNVDGDTLTECAVVFCEMLENAGYRTMIYGNYKDMARYDLSKFSERPLWHAEYNTPSPLVFHDISMWQYTDSGDVAGITGGTDLNILFLTAPQPML